MENRVVCSMAADNAYVISEYGPVGISAKISEKDRPVICGGMLMYQLNKLQQTAPAAK